MKTRNRKLLILSVLAIIILSILNIKVSYQQGINYQVRTIKIPLYFKISGFFDRHFNYALLVKGIIDGAKTDQERAMKIFEWTHNNIRRVPKDFPVVDDHVFNIIIRGYGTDDQAADVMATLCNYAGLDAFFIWIYAKDGKSRMDFSFVRLNNKWCLFDPYHGVYFRNRDGRMASKEDLSRGDWVLASLKNESITINYQDFFYGFDNINYKDFMFSRSAIQSPLRRLIYWLRSGMKMTSTIDKKEL